MAKYKYTVKGAGGTSLHNLFWGLKNYTDPLTGNISLSWGERGSSSHLKLKSPTIKLTGKFNEVEENEYEGVITKIAYKGEKFNIGSFKGSSKMSLADIDLSIRDLSRKPIDQIFKDIFSGNDTFTFMGSGKGLTSVNSYQSDTLKNPNDALSLGAGDDVVKFIGPVKMFDFLDGGEGKDTYVLLAKRDAPPVVKFKNLKDEDLIDLRKNKIWSNSETFCKSGYSSSDRWSLLADTKNNEQTVWSEDGIACSAANIIW